MLLVKFLIGAAIPDMPDWVKVEMAKLEHGRREMERGLGVTPPSLGGSMDTMDTEEKGVQTNREIEEDADVSGSSR